MSVIGIAASVILTLLMSCFSCSLACMSLSPGVLGLDTFTTTISTSCIQIQYICSNRSMTKNLDHFLFLHIYFNPIRSGGGGGGGFKSPPPAPPIFCPLAFNFEATLLCVGNFSQKIV